MESMTETLTLNCDLIMAAHTYLFAKSLRCDSLG
jgi:hypothetical protein